MKGNTYKERKAEKRYSVLTGDGKVIGVWGNLKQLCDDMKDVDGEFASYSSLSKKRSEENPMEFATSQKQYAVYIEKIRGGGEIPD